MGEGGTGPDRQAAAASSNPAATLAGGTGVTTHVSNPHDYVNHMFKRP
jgi:hypothetical protein